jgi:hypothetical protein
MIKHIREKYNENFTEATYEAFLKDTNSEFNKAITFRLAETPVFFDKAFKEKLKNAGEEIIDFLVQNDIKSITKDAIPKELIVPHEDEHSTFLALDFAVCLDKDATLHPQLIELQGFPSLYAFQQYIGGKYKQHFYHPEGFSEFFNGIDREAYVKRYKDIILNGHDPKHVILLEIEPMQQNTAIDFIVNESLTGVKPVCITEVFIENRKLYYLNKGEKTQILRIYNRVIFDELLRRTDLKLNFHLTEDVEVEWAGHPNWFFRISKYLMPFIHSKYVPECTFVSDLKIIPEDLENYVLKPLFSFSGAGVKFNVEKDDILSIPKSKHVNFMLQRKVKYEPILQAPDGMVKVEVRLLYLWEKENPRPELVVNLGRLSKGDMIGVKYNKDKKWVGGNVCFFEE